MEEYLKVFDKIFKTNTMQTFDFKNMKILECIFTEFVDKFYTPSEKYKRINREYIKISDKLESTFNEEQDKLFDDFMDLFNASRTELEQQCFMLGFIMCNQLNNETYNHLKE